MRNAAIILVLSITFPACNPPPDPRRTNFEVQSKEVYAKYDPKSGRLQRINIDQNKNGRMDAFSYWDGARLHRIEVDKDEDDKIDRWEHYDDRNKLIRVGSSSKNDNVEDSWAYSDSQGLLARVETDTDRDGIIDKRETFVPRADGVAGRVLSMVELGLDQAGKPSTRLYYRPNGGFDRSEILRP